jgi:hypothetical protein
MDSNWMGLLTFLTLLEVDVDVEFILACSEQPHLYGVLCAVPAFKMK